MEAFIVGEVVGTVKEAIMSQYVLFHCEEEKE